MHDDNNGFFSMSGGFSQPIQGDMSPVGEEDSFSLEWQIDVWGDEFINGL